MAHPFYANVLFKEDGYFLNAFKGSSLEEDINACRLAALADNSSFELDTLYPLWKRRTGGDLYRDLILHGVSNKEELGDLLTLIPESNQWRVFSLLAPQKWLEKDYLPTIGQWLSVDNLFALLQVKEKNNESCQQLLNELLKMPEALNKILTDKQTKKEFLYQYLVEKLNENQFETLLQHTPAEDHSRILRVFNAAIVAAPTSEKYKSFGKKIAKTLSEKPPLILSSLFELLATLSTSLYESMIQNQSFKNQLFTLVDANDNTFLHHLVNKQQPIEELKSKVGFLQKNSSPEAWLNALQVSNRGRQTPLSLAFTNVGANPEIIKCLLKPLSSEQKCTLLKEILHRAYHQKTTEAADSHSRIYWDDIIQSNILLELELEEQHIYELITHDFPHATLLDRAYQGYVKALKKQDNSSQDYYSAHPENAWLEPLSLLIKAVPNSHNSLLTRKLASHATPLLYWLPIEALPNKTNDSHVASLSTLLSIDETTRLPKDIATRLNAMAKGANSIDLKACGIDYLSPRQFKRLIDALEVRLICLDNTGFVEKTALSATPTAKLCSMHFGQWLRDLTSKQKVFDKPDTQAAKEAIGNLKDALVSAKTTFLLDNDEESFKTRCETAINDAQPTLEQHRGLKPLLNKILSLMLSVLTLGAAPLLTHRSPQCLFKPKTDSQKLLEHMENDLNQHLAPSS